MENLLLAALPAVQRRALLECSERVELVTGETLTEPNQRIRNVFFPTTSVVSLITPTERRSQLEVGLIGNEGMLGVSLILGVHTSPLRALVRGGGSAWRMDGTAFSRAPGHNPALGHQQQVRKPRPALSPSSLRQSAARSSRLG